MVKQRAFNILGTIAIVNFPDGYKRRAKKKFAREILKVNSAVKTVLEKSKRFHGRLRKMKTKHLAGEKNKEVLYRENDCIFRFNIDTTYFSPRLSNERKDVASLIKKNEEVFVMFAGVSPYPIVLGKKSKAKKIYSNELNREANKYGELNIERNKLKDKVELVPGDIKKVAPKMGRTYDVIVMPRPQLKDSFLEQAFMLSHKGTRVYYYDFCKVEDIPTIVAMVEDEAKKANRKIKISRVEKAGEIAPYKVRLRVDFKVLN